MSHENAHPMRADDLLAAYELGLLNETDRLRFEQATLDDPDLLDELFDHASAAQALREDPERFASLLRETLREAEPSLAERLTGLLQSPFQIGFEALHELDFLERLERPSTGVAQKQLHERCLGFIYDAIYTAS